MVAYTQRELSVVLLYGMAICGPGPGFSKFTPSCTFVQGKEGRQFI